MWPNIHILKKSPNAQPPHKVRRISKAWLVFARKVDIFNFQKQTAVLNYESDCCLLPKKLNFPRLQKMPILYRAHRIRAYSRTAP